MQKEARTVAILFATLIATTSHADTPTAPRIVVHKNPTCGCCSKWISLVEHQGYSVTAKDEQEVDLTKDRYQVPKQLRSCHTATIGGFVFEGHVPVELVTRVLSERPPIVGLAVPGMPIGSPGMEMPGRHDPFTVIAFDRNGKQSVYERR